MKIKYSIYCTLLVIILILPVFTLACFGQTQIPHLEKRGTATQLIVDGKPFLILGGELHNSIKATSL